LFQQTGLSAPLYQPILERSTYGVIDHQANALHRGGYFRTAETAQTGDGYMMKLKRSVWELLAHGTALYEAAVFVMRGRLLKRQLRYARVDNRRETR
jgi:hypothetical protein